jgi:hypothetical protein
VNNTTRARAVKYEINPGFVATIRHGRPGPASDDGPIGPGRCVWYVRHVLYCQTMHNSHSRASAALHAPSRLPGLQYDTFSMPTANVSKEMQQCFWCTPTSSRSRHGLLHKPTAPKCCSFTMPRAPRCNAVLSESFCTVSAPQLKIRTRSADRVAAEATSVTTVAARARPCRSSRVDDCGAVLAVDVDTST